MLLIRREIATFGFKMPRIPWIMFTDPSRSPPCPFPTFYFRVTSSIPLIRLVLESTTARNISTYSQTEASTQANMSQYPDCVAVYQQLK